MNQHHIIFESFLNDECTLEEANNLLEQYGWYIEPYGTRLGINFRIRPIDSVCIIS
jgi:hypothetical protein